MVEIYVPDKADGIEISPGVMLDKLDSLSKEVVRRPALGGQVWTEFFRLGSPTDAFQLTVPDIRMPPNQFWPLHWHGCWIAVVVLEGTLLVGDWWMKPGDVFVSGPDIEYGPIVNGPEGSHIFEIFAKDHLALGGYALDYRDHPTLQGGFPYHFEARSPLNRRNDGHQVLPNAGVAGLSMSHLEADRIWDLGDPTDPDRGVMKDTRLAPGQKRAAHTYADWHAVFVLEGRARCGRRTLKKDDLLIIQPNCRVAAIEGLVEGAHLLECARTAKGLAPVPAA